MLFTSHSVIATAATVILPHLVLAAPTLVQTNGTCRVLPGDADWPREEEWQTLNRAVDGSLIRGVPLAEPACYSTDVSAKSEACGTVQSQWADLPPLYAWLLLPLFMWKRTDLG